MEPYAHYYVPDRSHWPIVGAVGLGMMGAGAANLLHGHVLGYILFPLGALIISWMLFGWFRDVILESHKGLYSAQIDRSFRWGMSWFIFSEIMFFAAFFGALFYARNLAVPFLGGAGHHASTHALLWPDFHAAWPLLHNPNPNLFPDAKGTVHAWGLPALNTALLLASGVTLTWAHWALKVGRRHQLILGLLATIILGVVFLFFQVEEYIYAHRVLDLTMHSGIYGSTFFMLTGFHGMHVTLGTIMLAVICIRCMKGHFTLEHHFGFEAVAWYWHFVDVVWLMLFVLVYWL